MTKDLLLEIGTEEMPANILPSTVTQLKTLAEDKLKAARLSFDQITVYATPRRLALIVTGASERQADETVKKRGPSIQAAYDENGNPTRAALGFARGAHVAPEDLVREGSYVWANIVNEGRVVEAILPWLFTDIVLGLTFPHSMRWGSEEVRFIRPIRWLVALCDEAVVPMEVAHVKSGRVSRGHRVLCKEAVTIPSPAAYRETLRKAFVIVDQDERREMIKKGLAAEAEKLGGVIHPNPGLLEEINYIVEYPTALCGRIDADFLKLPEPAIVTPMRDHQRYFPVHDHEGRLMPYFLTVRNGGTKGIENVQVGNERVLRARLDDAKFFFDNDRKKSLADHREDTKRINYQENMGSLFDKADRLGALTERIGADWGFTDEEKWDAARAAYLSKADLATGMVTEFTELEGEMGKEYALLDGEKPQVAQAIFEQYMPRFAGDILPQESVGRALSIADKLDNLAATFLRGLIPTGSQDPFALRRQTIGIINILTDGQIHWDVRRGIARALELLPGTDEAKAACAGQLEDFFRQRIRVILLDQGVDYDIIDAVLSGPVDDVCALFLRATSLKASGVKNEAELRQAVTRLANITKGKEAVSVLPMLFREDAEKNLWSAFVRAGLAAMPAYESYDYAAALPALRTLTEPINQYLDTVMVMVDDEAVRQNRISTLLKVYELFRAWGDFSKLA